MADFTQLTITEKGKSLLAQLQATKDKITFTSIKTSTYRITDMNNISKIEAKDLNPIQSRNIQSIEYKTPNKISVVAEFDNSDVTVGYNINTIGIYARLDKVTEILYAVCTVKNGLGDWMSENGAGSQISMRFTGVLFVSDLTVESVEIITEGYVKDEDFNAHKNEGGFHNVHGSSVDSVANAIITRNEHSMANIAYDEQFSNGESIINKNKLIDSITTLDTVITTNYKNADESIKTEFENRTGLLENRVLSLEQNGITVPRGISKFNPFLTYSEGDYVIVESYNGLGGGLQLIGWDELKAVDYQINEIPDVKHLGGDWGSIPYYFIVKSNKGEYTWTLQETIDNIKRFEEAYLTQWEYVSVYMGIDILMTQMGVLIELDIQGQYGQAQNISEDLCIYRQGVDLFDIF